MLSFTYLQIERLLSAAEDPNHLVSIVQALMHAEGREARKDQTDHYRVAMQEQYQAGLEAGREIGYESGHETGYEAGYVAGTENTIPSSYQQGYDKGFEDGKNEAFIDAAYEHKPAEGSRSALLRSKQLPKPTFEEGYEQGFEAGTENARSTMKLDELWDLDPTGTSPDGLILKIDARRLKQEPKGRACSNCIHQHHEVAVQCDESPLELNSTAQYCYMHRLWNEA